MKSTISYIILMIFILGCIGNVTGQEIHISSKHEQIEIRNDSSFINEVTVNFKLSDTPILFPIIYDKELEKVNDVMVFEKKGRRYKPLKDVFISEEEAENSLVSSKIIKLIAIPPETEGKITYNIACDELMYFSHLRFFSYHDIDTLKYTIKVPDNFHLSHNIIYKDSLKFWNIDSVKTQGITSWNIQSSSKKVQDDPLTMFGIYKNFKAPFMRTIVAPDSYKDRYKDYLNDWYLEKVRPTQGLNAEVIAQIDELTKGITDPKQKMKILYDYVKNNFKYVAIEIGMGAFIPYSVNEVFRNKQGDCKDLSNFLSQILIYEGVQSDIALASTFDHLSDCDFPSLSTANHVVCVAYINGKPVILDPTDPIHEAETPVESIQNRSILIVNKDGGEFYTVKANTPETNLIAYQLNLTTDRSNATMSGNFNCTYEGISGNFLKRQFLYYKGDGLDALAKAHYNNVFSEQKLKDPHLNIAHNMVNGEGNLMISNKLIEDNSTLYVFLDFIPGLFESQDRETLLEGTYIGSGFSKKVNALIDLKIPYQSFEPIIHRFKEKGVVLTYTIKPFSETILECNYEFEIDSGTIDKDNLKSVNNILRSFKALINDPLIIKNKTI
ncbi:transglutaminase-like domain-containing protein [Robertkochia solimangrovi]|uniref:transglutaminase-like domain-containing protein n=1 Tax=Robertkochia solimangrovi TaxID=2213046 RepID=UPI001F553FFF|nr:transglutaminase-like domain-containing protein [Robertkochia solimangrovi]